MLIVPRIVLDLDGASPAMRRVHGLWADLPHTGAAFHHVLGVSAEGRGRWGEFPEVMADDSFIEAMIPADRCGLSATETVIARPPRRWRAMVRVRARWTQGQRQLVRMGIPVRRVAGQKAALLRLAFRRPFAVTLYVAAQIAALITARSSDDWL